MRTIIILIGSLIWVSLLQAQSSISADGSAPNDNAMLDVQSPASGAGKGLLIPRVSPDQRTNANASLPGGLLDNSGNLRGGAAQGLIVYQTNGAQGLYFNTSLSAVPAWVYLGEETDPRWASASNAIVTDIAGRLSSNVWAAADSTTNYLPLTGGTMSGALDMGAQVVTNVAHIDFNGTDVSVGAGANGSSDGAAVGYNANGSSDGAAVGYAANGSLLGVAVGEGANGSSYGAAVGYLAKGTNSGAALGREANGNNSGAALGDSAVGSDNGAAVGYLATGFSSGAAMGRSANGSSYGVAMGRSAKGTNYGVAVGYVADGSSYGAAIGYVVDGSSYGATIGYVANGSSYGAAVGYAAKGTNYGVAIGYLANGANSNVAIGANANIGAGGTNRIAIGNGVSNDSNDTARIRGTLHLDGGSSNIYYRAFGSGAWSVKAFTIDHPLDPENKVLRHFCLEGPQVWNVYAGNAQLVNGQAVVELPDYYSALNLAGSEIYSLTPVSPDRRATAVIEQEVIANRFVIGGSADMKVSWTIKVLRNDPGCREDLRRRPVEQMKSELQPGQAEAENQAVNTFGY